MQEAEAFFNKPSPFKKFEERVENERLALLKEEAENKSKLQDDEGLVKWLIGLVLIRNSDL